MNILDFLKEKPIKEKEDFLNSLRSKIATKLKNTDDKKYQMQ